MILPCWSIVVVSSAEAPTKVAPFSLSVCLGLAGQPACYLSPVNHETLPGDKARVLGSEKAKEGGHVFRPA